MGAIGFKSFTPTISFLENAAMFKLKRFQD